MSDVEDYRKRLEGSASGGNTEDYYKLARDQEYNLLLNKEVALENAKSNAMKYTQNQINAQGFGGTGYGSSMQSGIYNNYMNKANEAYANYGEGIRNINIQENEAKLAEANDRFQSVTTMLQGADSVESMNKLLTDYGYGSMDENGNFSWNATKPEGMSDDDWYQMRYYYGMQKNALDQGGYVINSAENLANYMATQSGKTNSAGAPVQEFEAETQTLWSYATAGQISNGGVVAVTNGQGQTVYLKWTNNGFVPANQSDYKNANHQYTLNRVDTGKKDKNYNEWKQVK